MGLLFEDILPLHRIGFITFISFSGHKKLVYLATLSLNLFVVV